MERANPTPPVNCKYGAPMGRYTGPDFLDADAGKISLRRILINSGGYDQGGAYWGIGAPLWYAEDIDGNARFFRARNRDAAKESIRADFPGATFYR